MTLSEVEFKAVIVSISVTPERHHWMIH